MAVTPVIESADCTVSGSNTESGSWAVSHPAAAFGDLLTFNVSWDDSTAVTSCTAPAGPNGEAATSIEGPTASASTEVRGQAWYYVAAGAWASGTLTFTPSASESWSATVVRVPAGEFDAVTPIGANASRASTGTAETTVLSPAFTAGSSDTDGRLVWFGYVDTDPLSATNPTGWTIRQRQDLGAVAHGIATRNAAVTSSESIAGGDTWAIAGDSWASIAYVVRAPVVGDVTLAPSSDSTDVNDWVDLVATVQYSSTPVPGMGVTAASDDTAVAVGVVGTGQIETTPSGTWGVTHSSPGGTSPLGATLTRATEDSSTTFHEGYWTGTDLALGAASKAIFAAVEIKKPVGRDYVKLVLDDGVGGGGITFNCATGAVASTLTSLGAIEYGARDLGSNWWVLWVRCTTTSTNEVIVAVGANNDSFSSYVGDGATYCDIGRVWTMWPDVTDASGEVTVRVIGRADGAADITATSLADTSGASTITVGSVAVALTGASVTASAGTVGVTRTQAVSGSAVTASTGTLTALVEYSAALTGSAATASAGAVSSVNAAALSGSGVTVSAGTVASERTVAASGSEVATAAGTVTAGSETVAELAGVEVTALAGDLAIAQSAGLLGAEAMTAAGSLTADTALAITGDEAAAAAGSVTAGPSAPLSGSEVESAAGSVATGSSVTLAGAEVTVDAGTISTVTDSSASLAGSSATASAGAVAPVSSAALTGAEVSTAAGTLSVSIGKDVSLELTGAAATCSAGSVGAGSALGLSGEAATTTAGTVGGYVDLGLTGIAVAGLIGQIYVGERLLIDIPHTRRIGPRVVSIGAARVGEERIAVSDERVGPHALSFGTSRVGMPRISFDTARVGSRRMQFGARRVGPRTLKGD